MTKFAEAWYVEQWIDGTVHKFQSQGFMLRGTTMPPARMVGSKAHWFVASPGEAQQHTTGDDVKVMGALRETVTGDIVSFDAADFAFVQDINKTTANERDAINDTIAWAMGRKNDNVHIDAWKGITFPAGQIVGDYLAPMSLALALEAISIIQKNMKGWFGRVYCALPSNAWNQMMTFDQFTNSQWIGPDLPLTKMTSAKFWNGVNWFLFPDDQLPLAAVDDRDIFMWHEASTGYAANDGDENDVNGSVDWVPTKRGWLHQIWSDFLVKVIQSEGVVNIRVDDDAPFVVA